MAVVINDMEVVSAPPPASSSNGDGAAQTPVTSRVQQAHEQERAAARNRQRMERVRAH